MKWQFFLIVLCLGFTLISTAKNIELIIDASGSMRGRLANGDLKITAAKTAVQNLLQKLPQDISIACRAYGHQFPREKHMCDDTELLSSFDANRQDAAAKISALKAQGYTPITYVLLLAVQDFGQGDDEKTIILVSDGKETCDGDPCALADSLRKSGVNLVIHTVGFGVDDATRSQLLCISNVTGGQYFDAANSNELLTVLTKAVESAKSETVEVNGMGKLCVTGADISGHIVTNAATGEKVGGLSHIQDTIDLPAGIYNVTVGKAVWKSVQVKTGKTTVLSPGWLSLNNATIRGHKIIELETGEIHGSVGQTQSSIALMPGHYEVMFRDLAWPVKINAGENITLNPGTVSVKGASYRGHKIKTKDGILAARPSNTESWAPLVPGEYTIEINGKEIPFEIRKGEELEFTVE